MVGSVVEICNMALAHLRVRAISTIDDQTPEGHNCKMFYQQSVDETLRAVDWNFARKYASGVPVPGATIPPGWSAAFQYPADCAAIRSIARCDPHERTRQFTYSNEGAQRIILTNTIAPVFIYTTKSTPISAYDDDFVGALTYVLAMKMAIPITGKAELMTGMQQLARGKMALASADNFNEEPQRFDDPVPPWLAVRGVGGGRALDCLQPGGLFALPGQLQANPQPPMVTAPGEQIKPAYVPGLTAPVPPPEPILGTDEIYLHSVGGVLGPDGSLTVDVPPGTVDVDGLTGDF